MATIGLTALITLRLTAYFVSLGCDDVRGGRLRRARSLPDSWEEEAKGPGISHRIADALTKTHVPTKDNAGAIQDEAAADPSPPFGSMLQGPVLWQNTFMSEPCPYEAQGQESEGDRQEGA